MNPMFSIQYGLFVVTACQDGRDNGCITNTVMQVTSQPNRISVTVNKENLTHDMIKATGRFTASIISEKADFGLFKHFGFQSGREVNICGRGGGNGTADRRAIGHLHLLSRAHQTETRARGRDGGGQDGVALRHLRLRVRGRRASGGFHLPDLQAPCQRL